MVINLTPLTTACVEWIFTVVVINVLVAVGRVVLALAVHSDPAEVLLAGLLERLDVLLVQHEVRVVHQLELSYREGVYHVLSQRTSRDSTSATCNSMTLLGTQIQT